MVTVGVWVCAHTVETKNASRCMCIRACGHAYMSVGLIITIVVIVLVLMMFVGIYNKLVAAKNHFKNADELKRLMSLFQYNP